MSSFFFLHRRTLILGAGAMATFALLPLPARAGKLRDAVINLVEGSYEDDIDLMDQGEVDDLAQDVVQVTERVRNSDSDMRRHVEVTWNDTSPGRHHTERCPYCISVAQSVEEMNPNVTPVNPQIPTCFYFGGVPYVASDWGTLHRVYGGQVGPAEGYIVFQNGQYLGIGAAGVFPAEGVC
jgi:hypothetical protein